MAAQNNGAGFIGFQDRGTSASGDAAHAFLVKMLLGRMATATLARVVAVSNSGGLSPAGTVTLQPLVNQVDGAGNAVPQPQVFGCPYLRLQGGANAVILDPAVGDIGIAVFADRDISSVIATRAQANPGSRRRFDLSDGLYLGGVLNGTPSQYVQFNDGGITLTSPVAVTINAPQTTCTGALTVQGLLTYEDGIAGSGGTGAAAQISGNISVTGGNVTADGIDLKTHTHSGVQTGSGNTGGPQG